MNLSPKKYWFSFLKYSFWLLFLLLLPLASRAAGNVRLEINYDAAAFTAPASLQTATATPVGLPWEWRVLTPVYQYSFDTAGLYDPLHPLTLKIYYGVQDNYFKQIFIRDQLSGLWSPLPTQDSPTGQYVTAVINSPSGQVAVLSNPDRLSVGDASWYKYKNGLFAASPDYAKGTILRVTNLDNGKSVDVTVNDFGPERDKHPDRVVDLDYVAFGKIAMTGAGLIRVQVVPLKIVVPAIKQATPQLSGIPSLTASSAVIVMEKSGQVLWGKNETTVAPLASLTKLVAMKIFLDTKPTLSKVVTYKTQDEKYNYLYCKPGESARLKVADGETMTIENLLYSALVGSANNAVESLVRVSGLKREEFIRRMNVEVKRWGATSTHFIEPTGLSPQNVSSPQDYAIITKEVMSSPLLKKISTTPRYTFKTVNTKKSHRLTNTDRLLVAGTYPIIGSKTGYLDEAGYCLMTRVQTPQGNLILVNFGSSSKAANFSDNEQLIRYGMRLLANK